MFLGTGRTSSVIQAAGSPAGGTSARPNALVVLVKTKACTPRRHRLLEQVERAGDVGVDERLPGVRRDVRLVQRGGVQHGVHALHARRTNSRSAIEPDAVGERRGQYVDADDLVFGARSARTRASPRWPALPVTRMRIDGLSLESRRR